MSSFTHPQVVPNRYGFICTAKQTKNTMEVNGAPELLCFPHSSEYLPLCSAEQ